MPKHIIVAFGGKGFRLRLNGFRRWKEVLIGFPIVGHERQWLYTGHETGSRQFV